MSNYTYVCVPCRYARKGTDVCERCGKAMHNAGKHWRAPRKNNSRGWKRIENGEWLWDRRAVRHARRNTLDTYTKYETQKVLVQPDHVCTDQYCSWHHQVDGVIRIERINEREVVNYGRSPDVDMGG